MSAASCLLSEDQLLCAICLDIFTNPVTAPCGHNFCKKCISACWDNVPYKCPICKKNFSMRPEVQVNVFISEMVDQFKQKVSSSSEERAAEPGKVLCDICPEAKPKALKSCLVCLKSYCETHLGPHLTMSGLITHQLIDPVENLEGRICKNHNTPLELFCRNDQAFFCTRCIILEHKFHDVVPLKEEYIGKKAKLGKAEREIQKMIQKRRLKIQEIKWSVELSQENADKEKSAGVQIFTALLKSVQRGLDELIEAIDKKHKTAETQAEGFVTELEREISELQKRSSEVEQLSKSKDHLQFLQSFQSLSPFPLTKNWTEVSVHPQSYDGSVVRAVSQLEGTFRKYLNKKVSEAELKRVQQYAVDVTLDPDTAHPKLILSDDGKQVKNGNVLKNLPNIRERYSYCVSVLAKQGFSRGRFYYEVHVKGKTGWDLGVARESANRKGQIVLCPQHGYWTIWLRNGNEYKACTAPSVHLYVRSRPEKVGVFVDYEEGLVSFYDVDAADLLYSFTHCSFTEKIYPYFSPFLKDSGKNSSPLVICPVSHTE